MSQRNPTSPHRSPEIQNDKAINVIGLEADTAWNDWLPVDSLEFLETTIDLRVVLFHPEER